jgi:glycosyltransferase involved in cell wall biosynthesis
MAVMDGKTKIRLAIVVSHPIQYYVPLYRRLAQRPDIEIKVFFTWHSGQDPIFDEGFKQEVAWDIPLTDGYSYEAVPNLAKTPGSHHFFGLRNPQLLPRILAWKPDAVHITGYAYASHAGAIRRLAKRQIPVLFRGDSHLLDQRSGVRWAVKQTLLRRVYAWPDACLYTGFHNRAYFERFGVPASRLFYCPHSIDVDRFSDPNSELEKHARKWRQELSISDGKTLLLFAGKFEQGKRPIQLMRAINVIGDPNLFLIMVGDGRLGEEIRSIAAAAPDRFRVIPFQNQSRMPLVYRLADIFVLPSSSETWGLSVNEAIASGRRVLVSDKVGCAPDLVSGPANGAVFRADDWDDFRRALTQVLANGSERTSEDLRLFAKGYGISETERHLVEAVQTVRNTHA